MPDDKPIEIARPGHKKAQKALARHQAGYSARVFWPLAPIFLLYVLENDYKASSFESRPVSAGLAIIAIGLFAAFMTQLVNHDRPYRGFVARGDIIVLQPRLIQTWEGLCAERGIILDEAERTAALTDLFNTAQDLQPELARREMLENQPGREEDRRYSQALIRARLRREVDALWSEREIERQVDSDPRRLTQGVGVTELEVQAELDRLPSIQPPTPDTSPAPHRAAVRPSHKPRRARANTRRPNQAG